MNKTGKASQAKAKKSVSLIGRVTKVKTLKALQTLLATAGQFPASNPLTLRRRKRAVVAKYLSLGFNVKLNNRLQVIEQTIPNTGEASSTPILLA